MTTLSTHVLDTARGVPAVGVQVRLLRDDEVLFEGRTNADGRCAGLPDLAPGTHRLEFAVADYFRAAGAALTDPPFLDVVRIDFGVADDRHHHVPLLISPFGYTTYRGS